MTLGMFGVKMVEVVVNLLHTTMDKCKLVSVATARITT